MDDVGRVIDDFLARADIPTKPAGPDAWAIQLRGEHKLTIPVLITVAASHVKFESFFMRRPQDNLDRFYELLLRRNMRAIGVHFALDASGDVYLVGSCAAAGLDEAELDRILGAVLIEADGMFNAAIEVGFERYLAADRAWRASGAADA